MTESGDASPTRVEPVIFEDSYLQELPEENLVVLSDNEEESDAVHPGVKPSINRESFLLSMDPLIDDAVRFTNLEARRVITECTTSRKSGTR